MSDPRLEHLFSRLRDRYEVRTLIGQGPSASVYQVQNLRRKRVEALKVPSETRSRDPSYRERFLSDAALAESLDHPHILMGYERGEVDWIPWRTMPYVEGTDLQELMAASGRFEASEASLFLLPVLDALGYAHPLGIVHRDIKPSNILLDRSGQLFLADFKTAAPTDNDIRAVSGSGLGTSSYISPELISLEAVSCEQEDGRSDLYSLGVILYQMLVGVTPFRAEDPKRTAVFRLTEDPRPPSSFHSDLDDELSDLVMRALQRRPQDRFRSASEMREALARFSSSSPQKSIPGASVPRPEPPSPAASSASRPRPPTAPSAPPAAAEVASPEPVPPVTATPARRPIEPTPAAVVAPAKAKSAAAGPEASVTPPEPSAKPPTPVAAPAPVEAKPTKASPEAPVTRAESSSKPPAPAPAPAPAKVESTAAIPEPPATPAEPPAEPPAPVGAPVPSEAPPTEASPQAPASPEPPARPPSPTAPAPTASPASTMERDPRGASLAELVAEQPPVLPTAPQNPIFGAGRLGAARRARVLRFVPWAAAVVVVLGALLSWRISVGTGAEETPAGSPAGPTSESVTSVAELGPVPAPSPQEAMFAVLASMAAFPIGNGPLGATDLFGEPVEDRELLGMPVASGAGPPLLLLVAGREGAPGESVEGLSQVGDALAAAPPEETTEGGAEAPARAADVAGGAPGGPVVELDEEVKDPKPPTAVADTAPDRGAATREEQNIAASEPASEAPAPAPRVRARPPPPRRSAEPQVGGSRPMVAPRAITTVEPYLAPEHREVCGGLTVILNLQVDAEGDVVSSRLLREAPPPCATAATTAAEAYHFSPALDAEGRPISASVALSFSFREDPPE